MLEKLGIESYNNDSHHLVTYLYQETYNKEVIRLKAINSMQFYNNFIKFYIPSKPSLRSEMIADIYVGNNLNKYRIFQFDKNLIEPRSLLFRIINNR